MTLTVRTDEAIPIVRSALERMRPLCLGEPGCVSWDAYYSTADPRVFTLVEAWASEQLWNEHGELTAIRTIYIPEIAPHADRAVHPRQRLGERLYASGLSQRQIAEALGVSQPAVSQQLRFARELNTVHPQVLVDAAGPVLKALAVDRGYSRLAVFGSVARRTASPDSDIDLMVESPPGTSSFGFLRFKQLLAQVLGREVDLIDYGGLKPKVDDDIRREARSRRTAAPPTTP